MDYEKAYKDALERARKLNSGEGVKSPSGWTVCEVIFPELKESEDERIRKWLIGYFQRNKIAENIKTHDIIAWLEKQDIFSKKDVDDAYLKGVRDTKNEIEKQYEANYQIRKDIATFIFNYSGDIKDRAKWMDYLGIKVSFVEKQGEQKPYGQRDECMDCQFSYAGECKGYCAMKRGEQNPTNKVEPKFKVGDWITNGATKPAQISSIEDDMYYTYNGTIGGDIESMDKDYHLWTIQDAKDGDVLINGSNIFIFHFLNDTRLMGYCHINTDDERFYDDLGKNECFCLIDAVVTPATKEQRDTLIKAMNDAGYTFDFEKKELKKLIQYNN